MARRNPKYGPTRAAVEDAWETACALLARGPRAVTLARIGQDPGVQRSDEWVRLYLGTADEIRAGAVARLLDQVTASAEAVDAALPLVDRSRALAEALIPRRHHRAMAWAIHLADLKQRVRLAQAVRRILGLPPGLEGDMFAAGVLGILDAPALFGTTAPRDRIIERLAQMIRAVWHFDRSRTEDHYS